jgi:hypothetical protein
MNERNKYVWVHVNMRDVWPHVSTYAIATWGVLSSYVDGDGHCWPSYNTLCNSVGCSRPTLSDALKELESLGLISIHRQPGASNVYHMNYGVVYGGGPPEPPPYWMTYGPGQVIDAPEQPNCVISHICGCMNSMGPALLSGMDGMLLVINELYMTLCEVARECNYTSLLGNINTSGGKERRHGSAKTAEPRQDTHSAEITPAGVRQGHIKYLAEPFWEYYVVVRPFRRSKYISI